TLGEAALFQRMDDRARLVLAGEFDVEQRAPDGGAERSGQRQAQAILQYDADDAERGAPQREGVLAAGRLLVDRPEASERVELVGERDRDRHGRRWDAIVRPLRLV